MRTIRQRTDVKQDMIGLDEKGEGVASEMREGEREGEVKVWQVKEKIILYLKCVLQ